jgi:hypothetical protein
MPILAGERDAALDLAEKFPAVAAYGMLLLGDPKCAMATMVRERWSEIHNLTGDRFVLFVLERPADWTESYLRYWRAKLGDDFKRTWKQWQGTEEPGAAYAYLSLFHPALKPSQLPCLVLFTDAKKREVVVRPIPDWDKDSLFKLLQGITEAVQESADQPQAQRLEWLRSELTSPGARFRAAAGHVGTLALDYCKKHPASVVSTAVSVALAMSGAGLLTIPATGLAMLNVLKDTLPGTKSG